MDNEELQKSCFRFTEKLLYSYNDISEFIENTEKKIIDMDLEENITTVGAINYDSIKISPTFNINRVMENKAVDRVDGAIELQIELYRNKKVIKDIDQCINNLSPTHRDIIKYRYIEGLSWLEIVGIMNYEERQLRTKKNEAVKSIARKLFGIKVFEEEEPTLFKLIEE